MKLQLFWTNETGGDLINGNEYATIDEAKANAGYAFADGDVDGDDVIQAWYTDDDGEKIGTTAAGEWTSDDFGE